MIKKKRHSTYLEKQAIRLEIQVFKTIEGLPDYGKKHFYVSLVSLLASPPHPSGECDFYTVYPGLLSYDLLTTPPNEQT